MWAAITCRFVITGLDGFVLRKQLLIEPQRKFIHKKSIPLIRSTHLWFTHMCIYQDHCIKSMKLITLSCCLFLFFSRLAGAQPPTNFTPVSLSQTVIMNKAKRLQPSVLPLFHPVKPTLHTLHTIFMQRRVKTKVSRYGHLKKKKEKEKSIKKIIKKTLPIADCPLSL